MPLQRIKKRWIHFFAQNTHKPFLLLLATSFFVRFPFFFRDYMDRDESTFILMGQSWVDGFLPYTQLWDLKPPLTYAFFAIIISIFGKSFIAIRLAGVLIVSITAFFTYKICALYGSKKVSFYAAMACVPALSLFGSLQGVMSEHICMVFFVPGIYLLAAKKKAFWFLLAGVLMGITVMVKLNMAFPVLFIGLYIGVQWLRKEAVFSFYAVLLFGMGIVSIILATTIPYVCTAQFDVWWNSVILAPLQYTENNRYAVSKLAPFFVLVAAFLLFAWKKKKLNFKNTTIQLLTMAVIGVLYSFLKGGRINGHYLIQLHPMLLILVLLTLAAVLPKTRFKIPKYLAFFLLLIPAESYLEYYRLVKNKIHYGTFYNGEGFSVPNYLKKQAIDTKNIVFFEYHIGYWNLNTLPPTMASTHPSNICREALFPFYNNERKTSLEEIEYIMEQIRPKTIVIRKGRGIFDKKQVAVNQFINSYLKEHYTLLATVENADILQRLERF